MNSLSLKSAAALGLTVAIGLGLGSCQTLQEAGKVKLTPVVAPIAEATDWQPVNAGINPAFHRWESPLGSVTLYDISEVATALTDAQVQQRLIKRVLEVRQSLQQAGMDVAELPGAERLNLAGVEFAQVVLRAKDSHGQRLRQEHWLGVVGGRLLEIKVEISDLADARSYQALQALLDAQVRARLAPPPVAGR